jgi:hypothetical protein
MNLGDKLNNIAPIYYLNLDERPDRREYIESQFDYWKIRNFTRISTSRFKIENYEEWRDGVIFNDHVEITTELGGSIHRASHTLSYLYLVKDWLETTDEEYMIILEDDYDLSMIEYWHFDWEYLMNNIPYDWDAIQLSFENQSFIPCSLHPTIDNHGSGALLINREYAKKIVRLHFIEGKCNLAQKIGSLKWLSNTPLALAADYIISKNGRCYSIPLIYINPDISSYEIGFIHEDEEGIRQYLNRIKDIYNIWWKDLRDNYTLKDFFTYGTTSKIIKV